LDSWIEFLDIFTSQRITHALFLLSRRLVWKAAKLLRLLREEEEERNDELFQ
jgi:hypothetical protein